MRRSRVLVGTICTLVLLAAAGVWTVASAQQAGANWTVMAGSVSPDFSMASNTFQPGTLEINQGDSVTWMINGFHNVAIGRDRVIPFNLQTGEPVPETAVPMGGNTFDGSGVVNSGLVEDVGVPFTVTFTAPAGTYRVVCDIHLFMNQTIVVRAPGQPLAMSPAQVAEEAREAYHDEWVNQAIPLLLQGAQVRVSTTADGATVHDQWVAIGDEEIEGFRFMPQTIAVRAGDWVRWTNPDPEDPHTVTFLPGGMAPDPNAPPPPPEALPPGFPFAPAPGNVYSGRELVHSGAIWNDPRFRQAGVGSTFMAQFTTPGTYQYFCAFHFPFGQVGTIVVLPAGGK